MQKLDSPRIDPIYSSRPESRPLHQPADRLDFFAANAPEAIPKWFTHEVRPVPVRPDHLIEKLNDFDKNAFWCWQEADADLPAHLKYLENEFAAYWSDSRAWDLENQVSRYFQWRKFYAIELDRVLSGRK
jgi:hypothetical protein